MLGKTKNIRKKSHKNSKKKKKKKSGVCHRGCNNQNLKGIHAIGSAIIDVTDGQTTDGRLLIA